MTCAMFEGCTCLTERVWSYLVGKKFPSREVGRMSYTLQELLEDRIRALAPVLHPGMALGLVDADRRMEGLDRTEYGYMYSHHAKIGMREYVRHQDLGEWTLGGNPRMQGQMILEIPADGISMKVVKENRRVHPGGIPPANRTRPDRRRYRDPRPLQETLGFDLEEPLWPQGKEIDLLLLWDYVLDANAADAFTLRAVHTTKPGVFGQRVETDLSFEIQAPDTVFAHSRFAGDAEDEDLYSYQVDAGEEKDAN